jgi:hypothetical protein
MRKGTFLLAGLIAGIVTVVTGLTYSGPYRLLDGLLGAWLQLHFVNLTLFATFAAVAAPLYGVAYFFERFRRPTPAAPLLADAIKIFRQLDGPPRWLLQLGAVFILMGIYVLYVELPRGPLVHFTVRDLEDGKVPAGTYVEVSGGTVIDTARIESIRIGEETYRYYPMVDHANPPVLFLWVPATESVQGKTFRGILDANAMEGELASQLEAKHAIAARHYVLRVGQGPNPLAGVLIEVGGIVALILGIVWSRRRLAGDSSRPLPPAQVATTAGTWICACGKTNDKDRETCRRCWAARPKAFAG